MKSAIIIDDEPFYLDYFRHMLLPTGAMVRTYQCENDFAMEESKKTLNETDLIILDYRLKRQTITSLKLPEYIREEQKFTGTLLVCTTRVCLTDEDNGFKGYIDGILDKNGANLAKLLDLCKSS